MRGITDELRSLQRSLEEVLLDGSSAASPDPPVELGVVQDFKAVVDQMRQFLWFYIQAVSNECGGEQLMELLRQAARPEAAGDANPTVEQIKSLPEYALIHYYLPPNRKPN